MPLILSGQSIAEKKASLIESGGDLSSETERFLQQINLELVETRLEERRLSDEALLLYQRNAPEEEYEPILKRIRELRGYIHTLQESWREMISTQGKQEAYALWYQPETTLEQLIIDYGSQDYVYIMKPDVGSIKISVDSNLPIPRASWNEMLELILTQNGVGIRQLNPFLRELYLLKTDQSSIKLITNNREDLDLYSPDSRIAFVLTPEPVDVRRVWFFLDHFANHDSTSVQLVGRDILLVAKVSDVRDLLRLYDFIDKNRGDKEYRAISLAKVNAQDMAKILQSVFNQTQEIAKVYKAPEGGAKKQQETVLAAGPESNGLQVFMLGPQTPALFLVGTKEEIRHAEEVVRDIEAQIGGAREKVVFWYAVKHSSPEEMAEVLSKVYRLMVSEGAGYGPPAYAQGGPGGPGFVGGPGGPGVPGKPGEQPPAPGGPGGQGNNVEQRTIVQQPPTPYPQAYLSPNLYPIDPYFLQPVLPVMPSFVFPASPKLEKPNIDQGNFIVDPKTGSIVMVVEAALLPKIKELIARMDVPKKQVQIEVLLFEKRVTKQNNYGLNLLRLGSAATGIDAASILFNQADVNGIATGIFDFLWSRERKGSVPAFDLNYRFLISQDDVTVNANPSVLTVNQTPAFIAIQEEISINTGIVEIETQGGATLKDSFQRAQYGITLKITPTIHNPDENGEEIPTITLESDVTFDTFDTINLPANQQPNVTRRNIKNITRVADGESVILGGLRRHNEDDSRDFIPFLGEIPGVGKLFSETNLRDDTTEMFIFITPKIVVDPSCDLEWIRREELKRRPGDVPEFMCALLEAERCEKNRLFENWMTVLFGSRPARCHSPAWHNDDTCNFPQGSEEYDGR